MSAQVLPEDIFSKIGADNSVILNTLQKVRSAGESTKNQLSGKVEVISPTEQLPFGVDEILKITSHRNEPTIKYLETKILKLFEENEDLKVKLESVTEICPKCETELLVGKNHMKSDLFELHESPEKSSNLFLKKEPSPTVCSNPVEAIKSIIEHKNKRIMHLPNQNSQSSIDKKSKINISEQNNEVFQIKLDFPERIIQTCETLIEQLQDRNMHLQEKNDKLEFELQEYKTKAIFEEAEKYAAIARMLIETPSVIKINRELQVKAKILEGTIKRLQEDINSIKNENILLEEALARKKMLLQYNLDVTDKQINTPKENVEILEKHKEIKSTIDGKNGFEAEFEQMLQKNYLSEAYENDIVAFKKFDFIR